MTQSPPSAGPHTPPSSHPRLSPETLQSILQKQAWRQHRVLRIDAPEGQIVIKGQRPTRGAARYRLLNLMAGILGAPFLKSVPAWGGAHAQDVEVKRLRALRAAGLPVPAILHVGEDFFVMESLGDTDLAHVIAINRPEQAYEYWKQGGELLLRVHAHRQYLSQAFSRNFIVQDAKIGLIDFEDDPLEVMSLEEAQTRDWLAYLHSTVWLLPGQQEAMKTQLDQWLRQEPDVLQTLMCQAAQRLSWMRRFSTNRKRWGRDVVSIQAVSQLLHYWKNRRARRS